jgi:acetyltransferase-like isoleucine patch superfamily enzyme
MKKILLGFYCLINKFLFFTNNVDIKNTFKIKGVVFVKNHGNLTIGKNFKVNSGYIFNPIGGSNIMSIVVLRNANLRIGNNVGISNSAIFCSKDIEIGNNVLIGGDCKIYDSNFHSLEFNERVNGLDTPDTSSVLIDDGVFVGAGSVILKGVTIGKHSVVGAGSVVSKSIPPGQIWAGNPCRYVKDI